MARDKRIQKLKCSDQSSREIYPVCLTKLIVTMLIEPVLSQQHTMKLRMYLQHYILLEASMKDTFVLAHLKQLR